MPENESFSHLDVPSELSNEVRSSQLPSPVRHKFETDLGSDFSKVRIHEGHGATLLGAEAFARGSDIYLQPGAYQPYTEQGQKLLAHELTHIVQQRQGRVK